MKQVSIAVLALLVATNNVSGFVPASRYVFFRSGRLFTIGSGLVFSIPVPFSLACAPLCLSLSLFSCVCFCFMHNHRTKIFSQCRVIFPCRISHLTTKSVLLDLPLV